MKKNTNFLIFVLAAWATQLCAVSEQLNSAVVTASPAYAYTVRFDALFLKPGGSNLYYAVQQNPAPTFTPNWRIFDVQPGYTFGFDLGLCAHSCYRDLKVSLNWQHFNSSKCNTVATVYPGAEGPLFSTTTLNNFTRALGQVEFRFDEVNLNYGQMLEVGEYLHANLFGGISIAQILERRKTTFSNAAGTSTRISINPTKFLGAGPQFGVEMCYKFFRHFNLIGKTAISLLAGQMKDHTCFIVTDPFLAQADISSPNVQTINVCNRFQAVPAFYQKIGANYALDICKCCDAEFEVGYQVQLYLNALQAAEITTQAGFSYDVGARTFARTLSNFSLSGPFVGIDLKF